MIKIDKSDSKKLQFLLAATTKDDPREELAGINFNDNNVVGADGCRFHALDTEDLANEDLAQLEGTFDMGKVRAGENIIDPQPIDREYPKYLEAMPKQNHGALITLSPKFLAEFCKYLDKDRPVYIKLRGSGKPIELKGTLDGSDVYGLIMPMYSNESTDNYDEKWEPKK